MMIKAVTARGLWSCLCGCEALVIRDITIVFDGPITQEAAQKMVDHLVSVVARGEAKPDELFWSGAR